MLTLHQEAPFATITLSARAEMARHSREVRFSATDTPTADDASPEAGSAVHPLA